MRYILLLVVVFLFIGCIADSDSSDFTPNTNLSCTDFSLPTESYYNQQWSIIKNSGFYGDNNIDKNADINASHSIGTYTGNGITVAIIDNGFDINHPEIKDNIILKKNFTNIGTSDDVSQDDEESHGTAVAGIIASSHDNLGIRGISPNVKLILIKMPSQISSTIIIDMFNFAVNNGADIINCSWGTNSSFSAVEDHLNNLSISGRGGKGIITIFSSGNQNQLLGNDESAIEGVIGVGATNKNNLRTNYSNYGNELDLVVPGGEYIGISTIDPIGNCGKISGDYNLYDEASAFAGTSASAPILSGALALALQSKPSLTFTQIQNLIKTSSDKIGQNTPYIDEMKTSSSTAPTITGKLGTSNFSNFNIRLTNESNNTQYGFYSITTTGNNWESTIDTLPETFYKIELVSTDGNSTIYATLNNFEINTSKSDLKYTIKQKSDFYGYGKLNLDELINQASSL